MDSQTFWNEVGSKKDFEDPLYVDRLKPYIDSQSSIVEYGCGYGRLLNLLFLKGYRNLAGYDFAKKMVERGNKTFPHLKLFHIPKSGEIPLEVRQCDVVILSTILCCTVDRREQVKIIDEVHRILKPGGIIYISDFIICDHPRYRDKYLEGEKVYGEWGIYTTSEGITVRHHSTKWVMELLKDFDIQWFEQFDFKTMNQNYARTFHLIAKAE